MNKIILVSCIFLFSGCSSFDFLRSDKPEEEKEIIVKSEIEKKVPLNLPEIEPLNLEEFQWIVITPDNMEMIWKEMEEKKHDMVLIALTDDGYEIVSKNQKKVSNYILLLRKTIEEYKHYYEP